MDTVETLNPKVVLVPWGDIENPEAPRQWGLRVGTAYVCRGRDPLLFATPAEAKAEAEKLLTRLRAAATQEAGRG